MITLFFDEMTKVFFVLFALLLDDDIDDGAIVMMVSLEDQRRAQEVVDLRVVPKTRKKYLNCIKKFQSWLEEKYPSCVETVDAGSRNGNDDDDQQEGAIIKRIRLPLIPDVVLAYLGAAQKDQQGKLRAVSTMVTISSAISDLYRQRATEGEAIVMCPILKSRISTFMSGHKRMVASAKQRGELPIQEGKRYMTFKVSYASF